MVAIHQPSTMSDLLATPYLSVAFPVQGTHLPADHGYPLYAAITHLLPALHSAPWLGIELISGIPWDKGIVTIKSFTEPEPFLDAARRQLTTLSIDATLELPRDGRTRYRRIICIHGKKVVGFSLVVHGLSDQDSITLQSLGLGGRRTMGCGLFNPIANTQYLQGNAS